MIARIEGKLLDKQPPQIVVAVGGLGYELEVPMSTFYQLPGLGEVVQLHTHLQIREDAHLLYGFASKEEKQSFRELMKVTGIGARTALSILSGLTVTELALALENADVACLSRVPGIGKKTAERMVLELRGKLPQLGAPVSAGASGAVASAADDVLQALLALGYSDKEARQTVGRLPEGLDVSDGIRQALKLLARN